MTNSIVVDSSPLIILLKSGLVHILPALYETIFVPNAVWHEVLAGPEDDVARKRLPSIDWITRISVPSELSDIDYQKLGKGEAEVIFFAFGSTDVSVLLDDAAARSFALSKRLKIVGTGGLLVRAKRKGLIESFSDAMRAVKNAGLWVSPELEMNLRKKAGE